jgi:hypothetical protein
LKYPEAQPKKEEGTALNTASSELVFEEEADGIPTPFKTRLDDQKGAMEI